MKNTIDILNCYYYAPHNHSILHRHLDWDLEKMLSLGTDTISICVQEDGMKNWHQKRIRNFVKLAKSKGLKVHAVPNRWCGLLAGWLDGFSWWTLENADTWYEDLPVGFSNPKSDKVQSHYKENLKILLDEFEFDGIIWDEPRPAKPEVIEFLDEMSEFAKNISREVVISMFADAPKLDLAEIFAKTRHMDYLGSDGHVRSVDHQMHRMKTTIFEAHAKYYPILEEAKKKTFFLLEGQRHRDEDLENYLENLEKAFALPMDHMMYYYSAHEMTYENEQIFNKATWDVVKKISESRKKSG
ncbi:MAG: hypothetical protein MI748_08940 [Opitutales bacterium]|nr:hypothetical protein [Opitutales bacterium]